MDALLALRKYLHDLNPIWIYAILFATYILAVKLTKRAQKTTLFIWLVSTPLTAFIYIVWIERWLPRSLDLYDLVVYGLLFAQLGWLGATLSAASQIPGLKKLSAIGFYISAITVLSHTSFAILVALSDPS